MAARPSSQDAARRLAILKLVVVHAMTAMPRGMIESIFDGIEAKEKQQFKRETEQAKDALQNALRTYKLWDQVSPNERTFFSTTAITMTQRQRIEASWRIEAALVLAWALRRIANLPPYDVDVNPQFLKSLPRDPSELIATAELRPQAEIDRRRDVAELWHWRSRTRELNERGEPFPSNLDFRRRGLRSFDDIVRLAAAKAAQDGVIDQPIDGDFPAFGKAYRDLSEQEWAKIRSITMERHFALNWLCGHAPGGRWDETPTGT